METKVDGDEEEDDESLDSDGEKGLEDDEKEEGSRDAEDAKSEEEKEDSEKTDDEAVINTEKYYEERPEEEKQMEIEQVIKKDVVSVPIEKEVDLYEKEARYVEYLEDTIEFYIKIHKVIIFADSKCE